MQAGLEAMLVQVCWLSYGIMMVTEDYSVSACASRYRRAQSVTDVQTVSQPYTTGSACL